MNETENNNNKSNSKRKEIDQALESNEQLKKAKLESDTTSCNAQSVFEQAMEFVRKGDLDAILQFLQTRVMININIVNKDNYTLLMQACKEGSIDSVLLLLGLGADMNLTTSGDFAALNIACLYGHMDIAKLLLVRNALVNNCTVIGGSALMSACEGGHLDLVKYLVDLGADVNAVKGKLGTALRAACYNGNIETIKLLLVHGAIIDLTDSSGTTALMEACRANRGDAVALLLENKADVNVIDTRGCSALIVACIAFASGNKGYLDILRLLARHGALVDQTDSKGDTALIIACRNGLIALDLVKVLLELHADVNKPSYRGLTPLMAASSKGCLPSVETLIDAGGAIDAVDDLGRTASYFAADVEVLKLLLSRGADVNIVSKFRGSVLLAASGSKKWSTVEFLLELGACLYDDGILLINRARRAGQSKIVDMLLDREVVGPVLGADLARLAEDQTTYPDLAKLNATTAAVVIGVPEDGSKLTFREVCARIKSGELESFRGASREAFMGAMHFDSTRPNALITACNTGRMGVLELLLDFSETCKDNMLALKTARAKLLIDACLRRRFGIAKLVLTYGAGANFADEKGRTALIAACYPRDRDYGYPAYNHAPETAPTAPAIDLVKLLIFCRADRDVKGKACTPLVGAALAGDIDVMRQLLYEGADVEALDTSTGDSAALAACRSGNLEALKLLHAHGANMRAKDGGCLAAACMAGKLDLVEWLLDRGAEVNAEVTRDGKKISSLSLAYIHGHVSIAQLLLKRGATLHPNLILNLPTAGSLDILKLLVANGADVNRVSKNDGRSPLHIACLQTRPDVVVWLLEHGADVTKLNNQGKTALDLIKDDPAFYYGKGVTILEALLKHGAGLDTDTSAILLRASGGCVGIVRQLLARRVPGSDTKPLSAALYNACKQALVEMMRILLEGGATVAEADEGRSSTCLCEVSSFDNVEAVQLLLRHGAEVNGRGQSLTIPLMVACRSGYLRMIKFLLAHGADIDAADEVGYTALLMACMGGRIEVFKLLLASGVDINHTNNEGDTALILAAKGKKSNRIGPLLEAGADVTATNSSGETAVDHLLGHPAMLELCERYRERNIASQKPLLK